MLDINELIKHVAQCIVDRPYFEKRPNVTEDDGLHGLLMLSAAVMKLNPPFKDSPEGRVSDRNTS